MAELKEVKISNFRIFKELKIDNLSKVNIFIGKNNSGKTSILEALFFIFGMFNPDTTNKINMSRGLKIENAQHLQYFFHNLSYENKPYFYGKFDTGEERYLNFEPIRKNLQNKNYNKIISSSKETDNLTAEMDLDITGLNFDFSLHKPGSLKKSYKSSIVFNDNQVSINIPQDYKEKLEASFLINTKDDKETLINYSEILKRNNKEEKQYILNLLQFLDPNITDIQALPNSIYFGLQGVSSLVPMNIMGDGVRRLFRVISHVLLKKSTSVFIDEIENGLHFSTYKLLWEGLLNFSEKFDIQLFITTHNWEMLSYLQSFLSDESNERKRELMKIFTVARTENKGYQTYGYTYNDFKNAINNNIDLRI